MSGAMIVKSADTGTRHAPHPRHTPAPHLPAPTSCRRLRIKAVRTLFYCYRLDAGKSTSFPALYLISTRAYCTPFSGSFRWFAIIKMAHWGTMPPPPAGALSNSPIPLIRGGATLCNPAGLCLRPVSLRSCGSSHSPESLAPCIVGLSWENIRIHIMSYAPTG